MKYNPAMKEYFLEIEFILETILNKKLIGLGISFKIKKLKELDMFNQQFDIPYRYSVSAQTYYSSYFESGGYNKDNFILSIFQGAKLIGLAPISISKESRILSSNGEAILFPYIFVDIDKYLEEEIYNQFLDLIFQICLTFDLNAPIMQEYALKISPSIDERLVSLGARILSREVYVKNCKGSHEEIWRGIRKSYKSYINKGIRELSHGVITGKKAFNLFDSFRELHLEVSGRITRSDLTWEIQKSEVLNGFAFLAYIKIGENIVGCSFVPHNRGTALYAVGAYRRDLTNLNLGHISQWLAIEHLNSIGVHAYRLGHLEIGQGSANTPKELSIAQFKRGFASETKYERLYQL